MKTFIQNVCIEVQIIATSVFCDERWASRQFYYNERSISVRIILIAAITAPMKTFIRNVSLEVQMTAR